MPKLIHQSKPKERKHYCQLSKTQIHLCQLRIQTYNLSLKSNDPLCLLHIRTIHHLCQHCCIDKLCSTFWIYLNNILEVIHSNEIIGIETQILCCIFITFETIHSLWHLRKCLHEINYSSVFQYFRFPCFVRNCQPRISRMINVNLSRNSLR